MPAGVYYQGRIEDSATNGLPDGEYEFSFLIYDAETGGNLIWSETQPDVNVINGIYKVHLGGAGPMEFSSFNKQDAWLEARIFGETLGPRRRIVSVPFAMKAEGEVPEGGIVLGELDGDTAITGLGYTQQGDTIGSYYLYKKDAYNPSQFRMPQRIAYQGMILPADGGTVGSTADLTFTIHDADTAGTSPWSETQNSVPLNNGLFSVYLGAVNPIYPTHLYDKDLWLATCVNGEALLPREKLASVAYALVIESPTPEGAIVLGGDTASGELSDKKFTRMVGDTLGGYYLYQKAAFDPEDPSVPLLINYQGRLTDLSGFAAGDTVSMEFAIFESLAGSTLLWSETVPDIDVSAGVFNVLLGGGSTISPETFSGPDAWMELKIIHGATTETLSPRQRITSVPFALQGEDALPASAMILGSTIDDPILVGSGFQTYGDTLGGYYVYVKTDTDVTPPDIDILSPLSGLTTGAQIDIDITYSDDLSGIDLSTFAAYLNDVDITSSLSVTETGASGSVTGSEGGNRIFVIIGDRARNMVFAVELVLIEAGSAPIITINSPQDGVTLYTNTPIFIIEYYDTGCGIDLDTLEILLDSSDITGNFLTTYSRAIWNITNENPIADGPHTLEASVSDFFGNAATPAVSDFDVETSQTNPTLTSIFPDFTIGGNSVTIIGTGFSSTVGVTRVYFSGTMGGVTARVLQASPTLLDVTVPGGALTGKVWVENIVGGYPVKSNELDFILGLPYAYITNRNSHRVTVIDYRYDSVVTSFLMPGANPQPYGAAVTPDGRWLFVANRGTNTVTVMDTINNLIVNTINIRCKNTQQGTLPDAPFAISVSPDGSRAFAVTNNKHVSVIEVRNVVPETIDSATVLCNAVSNYNRTGYGSSFQDIGFTPDGQRAIVPTNGSALQGIVISLNSGRTYISSSNSNADYMMVDQLQLQAGEGRNPQGVASLPQRTSRSGDDWMSLVTNLSTGGDQEDGVLIEMPRLVRYDEVETDTPGKPVCYGGKDAAISPLGERAFIGFYYSNNVGMLEALTTDGTNEIWSATQERAGCPPTCSGPGIREVAYTPFLEKVLATIWWINGAESKVMVLDASTASIPRYFMGTIPQSSYTFIQASSINGPEGIAVSPLFDRDGDGISDLVEATAQSSWWSGKSYFWPTIPDEDPSMAGGTTTNGFLRGGVQLPQEGIGYYHFHGETEGPHEDNWGTLKLIKVLEQVGREWNQIHPEGPRIGVGDMSQELGGQFCWYIIGFHWPPIQRRCHVTHQQGLNADIRYIRSDGKEQGMNLAISHQYVYYSQNLTQEMVNLLCEAGVTKMYVDPEGRDNLVPVSGCEILPREGHHHHIHIIIEP